MSIRNVSRGAALAAGFAVVSLVFAAAVQPRLRAQTAAQGSPTAPEVEALKRLQWRSIGPTVQTGRIPVFVGLPGDAVTMYVAGAVGGVFKTTNGGVI